MKEIMKQLTEQTKKFIVLAPTNKACRNISKDAMTIHRFLSSSFHDQKTLIKKLRDIEYLFVDEISMVREVFFAIFLTIKTLIPGIRLIMAGDVRQLKSVCDRVEFNYLNSRILFELCNGNRLLLTKCRRSDDKLYNASLNVDTLDVDSLPKLNNEISICYTNKMRIEVNSEWMKKKAPRNALFCAKLDYDPNSQDMRVYKGLPLIARMNALKLDIANNETFEVFGVNTKERTVIITDGDRELRFALDDVTKYFNPAYCITTHRAQGSTIDKPMTIYEWDMMDTEMRYTALTRATKYENISICH